MSIRSAFLLFVTRALRSIRIQGKHSIHNLVISGELSPRAHTGHEDFGNLTEAQRAISAEWDRSGGDQNYIHGKELLITTPPPNDCGDDSSALGNNSYGSGFPSFNRGGTE
jgi:hypothetical protein